MGADVTIFDKSLARLAELDAAFTAACVTIYSTAPAIETARARRRSGDRRGAGARAPPRPSWSPEMLSRMKKGAVHCGRRDRSGRLLRNCHATTHTDPIYIGGQCRALLRRQHAGRRGAHFDLRAQQRHVALCADAGRQGMEKSAAGRQEFPPRVERGQGKITHASVAEALDQDFTAPEDFLQAA